MSAVTQIDIESVLAAKMKRRPSRWMVWLLKKTIRQDWYNDILRRIGPYKNVDFMRRALEELPVEVEVSGIENLPASDQRCLFVCNHPLGGVDVLAAVATVGPHYPTQLLIPANDMLQALTPIREMLIPVNKTGGQSRDLADKINHAFESEAQIMFFPAGMVSRRIHGVVQDCEWKKVFVIKARDYLRQVVPVRIEAVNSAFFYWVAKIRAFLRIKLNLEMMLLPREVYRQQGRKVRVKIGKPIPYDRFDESKTPLQWAQEVRNLVYTL
ncbi:MAG: 1-acyl-sn-glycerol-3-phosphate acyltransferase [Paludibacteraceae bacterium]|nr:1-acyl-sn-glycerol-3-phosphate acyltransferase [Paludibacteraceae bacterium]